MSITLESSVLDRRSSHRRTALAGQRSDQYGKTRHNWISLLWLFGCLALGVLLLSQSVRTESIENIRPGDSVLAFDPDTKTLRPKLVRQTFCRESDHLRILTFAAPDGTEQALRTTDEHPFWVVGKSDFVKAKHLKPGDEFQGPHGELQQLISTVYEPHPKGVTVYNIEVEGFHTYYVAENGTRGPPVLVHNKAAKFKGNVDDIADLAPKSATQFTKSNLRLGQQMHKAYRAREVLPNVRLKEFVLPSQRRIDFIDFEKKIIYELKPNNPRAIREGQAQLAKYLEEIQSIYGDGWRTVLDTY